jgi:hypothetical protein
MVSDQHHRKESHDIMTNVTEHILPNKLRKRKLRFTVRIRARYWPISKYISKKGSYEKAYSSCKASVCEASAVITDVYGHFVSYRQICIRCTCSSVPCPEPMPS